MRGQLVVTESNSNKSLACDSGKLHASRFSPRSTRRVIVSANANHDAAYWMEATAALLAAAFNAPVCCRPFVAVHEFCLFEYIERFNLQRLFSSSTVLKYCNDFRILMFTSYTGRPFIVEMFALQTSLTSRQSAQLGHDCSQFHFVGSECISK